MNKGKCWDIYDLIERDERRKQAELRRMERDKEWRIKMKNQNRLSDKEVSLSIDILESVLNWYKGLSAVRKLNAKQEKYLGGKDE